MKNGFISIVFCLLVTQTVLSQSGWIEVYPGTHQAITSVFAISQDHVWAVGGTRYEDHSWFEGKITHSIDGGMTWNLQESGVKKILRDVFFLTDSLGWVVGYGGAILKTTDSGNKWMIMPSDSTAQLESVFFINEQLGWACGTEASIARTIDGGLTWTYSDNHLFKSPFTERHPKFRSVFFINETTGWVVGHDRWILFTDDGGVHWHQLYTIDSYQDLRFVQFIDENLGYAIGEIGLILKTTDGGNTWTKQESGTWRDLWAGSFMNENIGWAAGAEGTVLKTTDGGEHWIAQESGTGKLINDIYFVDQEHGWIAGEKGLLLRTTTGGDVVTQPPFFTCPLEIAIEEGQPFAYSATADDPQNHTLAFSYTDYPDWMEVNDNEISGTPTALTPDTCFTVKVNNGAFEIEQTVSVTIIHPNSAPFLTSPDTITAIEESQLIYVIQASDPNADEITISVEQLPDWLSVSNDTISGTPDDEDSNTQFKVNLSDGNLTASVWITVNVVHIDDAPEITQLHDITLKNQEMLTIDLDTCVVDPDNELTNLRWEVTVSVPEISLSLQGHLLSLSTSDWMGTADLSFKVSDPEGASDSVSVELTVFENSGVQMNLNRSLPLVFDLSPNYPNPFNPLTEIHYAVPYSANIEIVIYNARGELVEILVSGHQNAGFHLVRWHADHQAAGLYFIRMQGPDFVKTHKCLLVK